MAAFRTHITTSTVLGMGYGAAGWVAGLPPTACLLSVGLCGVSGMLPDLDSDKSVPVRETWAFAAAVVPMLMLDRFVQLGLSHESIVLAAGLVYLTIRFGVAEIFRRYTVHRGMWHSVPAACTAFLLAFLICACPDMTLRLFKSAAVFVGFLSHLIVDEIYSIQFRRGRIRRKRSSGTALKLWSRRSLWANVSTYGKLLLLLVLAIGDPVMMEHLEGHRLRLHDQHNHAAPPPVEHTAHGEERLRR